MTSEIETLKTNEFLRRRKLRLQQVREQSKDIAKKIRQRTKSEILKQRTDVDEVKEKEFLQRQEKIVKRLEELYVNHINNIGAGHKNAAEEEKQDLSLKVDLSKLRGRDAVAELRRRKQESLNEKNKLLERKLQAREIANEISRDKSSTIANKFSSKIKAPNQLEENKDKAIDLAIEDKDNKGLKVTKSDMATQWDSDGLINEWVPSVPVLALPRDDKDSVKNSDKEKEENKSENSKRLDLFALSDEMPSSLRGGVLQIPEQTISMKPSLTLVSEYIQNRALNLRNSKVSSGEKQSDDLQTIKQTILKTKALFPRGSSDKNLCHVIDGEMLPVPPWQAENNCQTVPSVNTHINYCALSRHPRSNNPQVHPELSPNPIIRGTNPFRRNKFEHGTYLPSGNSHTAKSTQSTLTEASLFKKPSVTMYNHMTRDSRNIHHSNEGVVVRDVHTDEDAYSQAIRESAHGNSKDRENRQRIADMRNKAAMDKKTVEKEYKDTIAFLNSLPKDKGKPIKTAYMDERLQNARKESQQRKMQHEYNTIEKQCKKHSSLNKKSENRTNHRHCKSPSPSRGLQDVDRDFQYSWLPVPEGDGNLAIHTIPTTMKGKPGNSVKFSDIDSYHEYRSRHKHTPPTKEKVTENRKGVETIFVEENNESSETSTVHSDTSSVENSTTKLLKKDNATKDLPDAEKIIIYRILDSKSEKRKIKQKNKSASKRIESTSHIDSGSKGSTEQPKKSNNQQANAGDIAIINEVEELNEGIYNTVSEKGDNITSMYFCKRHEGDKITESEVRHNDACCCGNKLSQNQHKETGTSVPSDVNRTTPERISTICLDCKCGCTSLNSNVQSSQQSSATTTTSSFKTAQAAAVVSNVVDNAFLSDAKYIKFAENNNQEAGKFYIGASGFLKEDNYEVIIQLRKKDTAIETKANNREDITSYISGEKVSLIKDCPDNSDSATVSKTLLGDKDVSTQKTQHEKILNESNIENLNEVPFSNNSESDICKNTELMSQKKNTPTTQKAMCVVEYSDAGVDPVVSSSQLYNTLQDKITKSVPKLVSSACTQTSFSSPNSRHIHLSSSTSTAYMSPPEIILPKFLKKDYNYEDIYDRVEYVKNRNTESECTKRKDNCKQYTNCNRRRCSHGKKIFISKSTNTRHVELSPTSTGRSYVNDYNEHNYNQMHSQRSYSSPNTHAFIRSCHRAGTKVHSKQCVTNKNKQDGMNKTKQFSQNVPIFRKNSALSRGKKSANIFHQKSIKLDPSLKIYIDKLLTLNNEGLKAIEVVNQECSAVTTPGSSIINVPNNISNKEHNFSAKISLEQIKNRLIKHIYDEVKNNEPKTNTSDCKVQTEVNFKKFPHRITKGKKVHKVKSLNISKRMMKVTEQPRRTARTLLQSVPLSSSSSSSRDYNSDKNYRTPITREYGNKHRSKSSPSPRQFECYGSHRNNKNIIDNMNISSNIRRKESAERVVKQKIEEAKMKPLFNRATTTTTASNTPSFSDANKNFQKQHQQPVNNSTQTIHGEGELDFLKLAEDKLQNMEKIADLTERCTKRLSNLAKVLEDVRRNKSLAYSQISTSDSTSDSDQKAVKNTVPETPLVLNPNLDDIEINLESDAPPIPNKNDIGNVNMNTPINYIPFFLDIPKAEVPKSPNLPMSTETALHINIEKYSPKIRSKPPPALSRVGIKNCPDNIVPHELSTVLEVDSPMSVKNRHQSSCNDKMDDIDNNNKSPNSIEDLTSHKRNTLPENNLDNNNPELLHRDLNIQANKEISTNEKIDDSKLQMIDLQHFNEIMLKPFITLKEYAKQNNKNITDDGSNLETRLNNELPNDDISSMYSDGSLPDVIAELIKRNIINEPFKFDSATNVNSTSVSSDSNFSVLALSKAQGKKKSHVLFANKENIDTSESLSVSSNPDLEIAFKKLGMGWASSTLKKTKERLALSSSSNTSSSSLSQFKTKSLVKQDIPDLGSESVSSILHVPKKNLQETLKKIDSSKNAEQQTLLTNSMTVKEFLTNELAKKITFTNKSNKSDTIEEFVSLYETKIPEEIKYALDSQDVRPESTASNNRARTSTPVQIYKSQAYHSSSSSNLSNGLFSNVEDLSSVKGTSNSMRNHSTSDKDDLTIPNFSLKIKKGLSDRSKSD